MAIPKKQLKDEEQRKIFAKIFDNLVLKDLFKLKAKGIFEDYFGVWKEGKESKILIVGKNDVKMIIKVYKIEAGNFKNMIRYLHGDERFKRVRERRRDIIYAWCKKEYHNLMVAKRIGLRSPAPVAYIHNIIVMEMIGKEAPYPQLREVNLENPEKVLDDILQQIKKLLREGKIVHGDISEFNILIDEKERAYLIDFAQAVLTSHPFARDFFVRDVKNLLNYFNKKYNIERDAEDIILELSEGVF